MEKAEQLRSRLSQWEEVLVAYSGGVDSAYLLAVAADVLGKRVTALTATSPSVPAHELEAATTLARSLGVQHVVIQSNELDDPNYRANPTNRCFYCKSELYTIALTRAKELGVDVIADGTNADDLTDWRPGRQAAIDNGVVSPLADVGLTKSEIRQLSRELELPTWDKPAAPCLASRIPYGTEVTSDRLKMVEEAERAVAALGFKVFRVRYHDDVARLEIAAEEMEHAWKVREQLIEGVKAAGFRYVALDLAGFRSGSLNVVPNDDE